ncbi:hypothetical protein D2962_08375 [Biomaibacter acetigenes]|uniref:HNH nuclease domain-containing protein n=1 Tax=Biomaibacter acetigenes TaxID=2316383 RepID=A0A3G2R6A7_9FIRM|nr:HNH endonuclease [Biomaibacter acetigenes]AYO30638.1 hypothetical protein D2962_08375 [Biomaibacter acetigenes]
MWRNNLHLYGPFKWGYDNHNKWFAKWDEHTKSFYAVSNFKRSDGKWTLNPMHRYLIDAPKGMYVDHINHDTLDNRISNLRIVTGSGNAQNKKGALSNSKTGIRGVWWNKKDKCWRAKVIKNRTTVFEKNFKNIEEAEKAVREARKKFLLYSIETLA